MKIPLFNIPDKPLTAATQDHLPIAHVVDGVCLLKDGSACVIVESTSLNFGLLSENEQTAVIAAYAAFLNSLTFPVQIVVRTQRKDISVYMEFLDEEQKKITNPKLAALMIDYRKFIAETVKKKNVLGKRFLIVVPFSNLELGISKSFSSSTKGGGPLPFTKEYVLDKAKIILYPRRDHVIRQARRAGLEMRQLSTQELIELYYDVYNQEPPAPQKRSEIQ